MAAVPRVRRVILTVLDGLRADAIDRFSLDNWSAIAGAGASTRAATTVTPSVTAAAMGTLFTGAPPAVHGLRSDRFHLPRPDGPIDPMPLVLRRAGLATSAFLTRMPFLFRGVAARIAARIGIADPSFSGDCAHDVLDAAESAIEEQRTGLIFMHWPDADRAGHADGWMSPSYAAAARLLDDALGRLVARARILADPTTLLIALADHGGGGVRPRYHDSMHPDDRTIPIVLAGGCVVPGSLGGDVRLLDVPATVLHALGVAAPRSYAGRPLSEAFGAGRLAA